MRTNEDWVRDLRAQGGAQEAALKELRALLFRAIRSQLFRSSSRGLAGGSLEQRAEDYTQEALLHILAKLDGFRGESRFTTWAYTVALRLVLADLRRRRWQEVSLEQNVAEGTLPGRPIEDLTTPDPERALEQAQVWEILRQVIETELTPRQPIVLIQGAFRGMPLDVIAAGLETSRDNVYKILHDARRGLKRRLATRQLSPAAILAPFELPR